MADRLNVREGGQPIYDIVIGKDFENLGEELKKLELQERRVCIVTETTVGPLYEKAVSAVFEKMAKEVHVFTFPAGEGSKNLDTVKNLYLLIIGFVYDFFGKNIILIISVTAVTADTDQ